MKLKLDENIRALPVIGPLRWGLTWIRRSTKAWAAARIRTFGKPLSPRRECSSPKISTSRILAN